MPTKPPIRRPASFVTSLKSRLAAAILLTTAAPRLMSGTQTRSTAPAALAAPVNVLVSFAYRSPMDLSTIPIAKSAWSRNRPVSWPPMRARTAQRSPALIRGTLTLAAPLGSRRPRSDGSWAGRVVGRVVAGGERSIVSIAAAEPDAAATSRAVPLL